MWRWEGEYRRSKGWFFSCDKVCQENWEMYRMAETEYVALGVHQLWAWPRLVCHRVGSQSRRLRWAKRD
jgi:hypothetical protein